MGRATSSSVHLSEGVEDPEEPIPSEDGTGPAGYEATCSGISLLVLASPGNNSMSGTEAGRGSQTSMTRLFNSSKPSASTGDIPGIGSVAYSPKGSASSRRIEGVPRN